MRTPRKTPLRLNPLAQALAAAALLVSPLLLQAQVAKTAPHTLPQGMQVVAGQARLATQGSQLTVSNSNGTILNWQSFNIGAAAGVHFEQAGAASKVLNRVLGHDPSHILGSLTSNGQVWLLNPNGVLFGAGARVDVAGLVASTLRLNDSDFLAGRYRFSSGEGAGATVRNEGSLRTSFGGQIVLLGERVENTGEARAEGGSVTLAAARRVELVDTGLPNLAVQVEVPAGEALNLGRLVADGGTVDVYGGIVNQQGLVQADALTTDAQGRIVLRASDTLTLGPGSNTRAGGERGGAIDLLGTQVALLGSAAVDASGASAGGSVRVGGGVMGQDTSVPNARAVFFGPQASIRADATGEAGTGGSIVLWGDAATRAYGTLSARGGQLAGDGGFIETSGGWIDARPAWVDVSSQERAGTWLIDPNNILINDTGPDTNITGNPNFGTTGDNSVISTATIAAALNAGNSVSITTGTAGANSQAGDILMDNATLAVTPGTAVSLTMNAARDIVVRDSTITSTAAPLSITLNSAGSGIGAIEVLRSTITTAGGDVTLQGTIAQQLTLPDGSLTATAYRPAVGYSPTTPPSITSRGGTVGVNVEASTLNLGSGTFRATGYTTVDNSDGLRIGSSLGGTTTINAATIDLFGLSFVFSPSNVDVGTMVQGDDTNLTATTSFRIEGSGTNGISIEDGARLALNAAPASGAVFTIVGRGNTDHGVSLFADDIDLGIAGRGTRITVSNGSLAVTADATLSTAITMTNDAGAPGPIIDLSSATGASFTVTRSASGTFGPYATLIRDVDLVLPGATTTTTFSGDLGLLIERSFIDAAGGTLALSGESVVLDTSVITSTAGALGINFVTTGATPQGVDLFQSIVTTNGGDIVFGASQTLAASALPATTVAANWVRTTGSGSLPALIIEDTVLDAGTGRIIGGGASTTSSPTAGVGLLGSSLNAREIRLAGRSDADLGLLMVGGTLQADRVLTLDGLSAGFNGLSISATSTIQLVDPTASAGSQMVLSGNSRSGAVGVAINGGLVGTGDETRVIVSGATLDVTGITSGGGAGIQAFGDSDAPGGLLFNTLGATAVTFTGSTDSGIGIGTEIAYVNLLGPQGVAAAPLLISGNGVDGNGFPGTRITDTTITTGGTLRVLGDGLLISGASLSGEAGVTLHANTGAGAPAGVPIGISASTISTSAAGAQLRIEGSAGDAARGSTALSGVGVTLVGSQLLNTGIGSAIVINGEGAAAGGSGVTFSETPMSAESITITGRGVLLGDGVFAEDLSASTTSVLAATNLTITGFGANSTTPATRVGVRLGANVELQLQDRGAVLISGDQVLLGNPGGATPAFGASGDPASFAVQSTGSQRLTNATFDFSSGGSTTVQLSADSDASGAGRVRLENLLVNTGGGTFSASGVGVASFDNLGQPINTNNTTTSEGATGVLINGGASIAASDITITGLAAPGSPTTQAGGWGINAIGTNSLGGTTVALDGRATAATGTGIEVGTATTPAALAITATSLSVTGQGAGAPGISVIGGSTWTASSGPIAVDSLGDQIEIDGATLTAPTVAMTGTGVIGLGSGTTRINAGQLASFSTTDTAALVLDSSDAPAFNAAFSGMGATSTVRWTAPNAAALTVSAPVVVPGRLVFEVPTVDLQSGASVSAGATGDALVLRGAGGTAITTFTNTAGASALSTPAGRWVLLLDDPRNATLGGLANAFSAYDLTAAPWALDASGNYITPAAGNAVGYALAASAVSGGALAGTQSKVYDASASITLSPGAWTVTGLVTGDTLAISGNPVATMNDKNVGTGKPVTPDAGAVFSVLDAQGAPVFGYAAPVFTATVTPAPLSIASLAAANKVYDAGTTATLASLGTVVPLGTDNVFVATASASFSDKNVGVAKPVAVTGVTLGGTDAANYTAVQPTGLSANITALALPVTGLVAGSRVYDTTTAAPLSGTATISPLAGDALTLTGTAAGSFADKNAGVAKPVSISGLGLAGTDAGNYTLVAPAGLTGTITAAPLPVTGLSATARVYDGSPVAPLVGTAAVAPLAGDTVTLAGTAAGAFADANVGINKAVVVSGLTLAGTDAGNYSLVAPSGLTATVSPATLTLAGLAAANKVYDATTTASLAATLAGVIGTDAVSLTLGGQFSSAGVGAAVPVTWTAALAGAAATNYQLAQSTGSTSAAITPATLSYVAAPVTGTAGQPLPTLGGSVTGLQGADTLATSTTGTLAWSSPATVASAAGSYPVTGGGLSALNYVFVQAPGNATALTLRQPTTGDATTTATTVVTTAALASVTIPTAMSSPTQGRVLDATPAFSMTGTSSGGVAYRSSSTLTLDSSGRLVASPIGAAGTTGGGTGGPASAQPGGTVSRPLPSAGSVAATLAAQSAGQASGLTFEALDWGSLPRDEVQTLLAARARYKQKVFERSVFRLQQDPSLADVQPCRSERELESGSCVITEALKREIQAARDRVRQQQAATAQPPRGGRRVVQAALPAIERKLALLIGVNTYKDKRVPELRGAVPDAVAVRGILEGRLGYETTVLENPGREEIVRAFNRLALQAEPQDSVIVYYAGHGVLVDIDGTETGFWLPSDVDAETPASWLSNADIARMVAAVGARQLMMVSDSCYSGQLVGKERVGSVGNEADELLKRKAAVVMSSGGDEPVADEGKNGHSVFAWHFMRALEGIQGEKEWQPGNSLFDRVKAAVVREFPQTPHYGASRSAGHQGNTDYLWERRQLEQRAP
jgi:filamentous hemagglutinin family protein